jgi:hypothetical protein
VDSRTIRRIHDGFSELPFRRTEQDDARSPHVPPTRVADVPPAAVALDPLFNTLNHVLHTVFVGEVFTLYRAYVNCIAAGDITLPHRDCDPGLLDVTVLYYVNHTWPRDWGGETVFFDDEGDACVAVSPKPGRIALFRGDIQHRVGVPTPLCPTERLTLAYKVRGKRA